MILWEARGLVFVYQQITNVVILNVNPLTEQTTAAKTTTEMPTTTTVAETTTTLAPTTTTETTTAPDASTVQTTTVQLTTTHQITTTIEPTTTTIPDNGDDSPLECVCKLVNRYKDSRFYHFFGFMWYIELVIRHCT